ncbi:MAG: hypothetical protein ACE5MG_10425 [Candidatus Methylomirabilales bacterium]
MKRTLILALVLTTWSLTPSAFAQAADVYDPANYPFYYNALYADLFWRCKTPDVGGVGIEGYAMASRGETIRQFEVRLIARDAKGKKLADRSAYGESIHTRQFKPVPFQIAVPPGGEKIRHDLLYSFEVPNEAPDSQHQFRSVENACGEKWRRKAK